MLKERNKEKEKEKKNQLFDELEMLPHFSSENLTGNFSTIIKTTIVFLNFILNKI